MRAQDRDVVLLAHEVVGARLQRAHHVLLGVAARHHQDREPEAGAGAEVIEPAAQLDAVDARHHQVHQDAVAAFAIEMRDRLLAGREGRDRVPFVIELLLDERQIGRAVVDHDHAVLVEIRGLPVPQRVRRHTAVAQQRMDARHQGVRVGRLRHVIVGTALQALPLDDALHVIGEDQDQQLAGSRIHPDLAAKLVAAHARQVIVDQDQVRPAVAQMVERFLGRGGAARLEPLRFEQRHELQRLSLGVLDHEDMSCVALHQTATRLSWLISRSRAPIPHSGSCSTAAPSRAATAGMP